MAVSLNNLTECGCPESGIFVKAATGEMPDDELDKLTDHINQCAECLARMDRAMKAHDPFVTVFAGGQSKSVAGSSEALDGASAKWKIKIKLKDRFTLISQLGSGGMGEVFECYDRQLDRRVAVKKIQSEKLNPNFMQRLDREARIQSGLNHPGIVQIYEVGQLAGAPYLAMELVAGESLKERLAISPLAPWQAAMIIKQVAEAVDYAHRHQVLHRDLKPSNILLTECLEASNIRPTSEVIRQMSYRQIAKLADFGLAKLMDDTSVDLTKSDVIVGTPAYLAPEQVQQEKKPLTPAVDIYALGVVLYECLTGHPPFQSHALNITFAMIESVAPVSPRQNSREISKDLETICLKCLEKEPEKRYRSGRALAEDIERYLMGRPVLARPINPVQKLIRWCRRNKSIAAALVVAAGCLVTLAGGSLYYANREAELRLAATNEAMKSRLAEAAARQAEAQAQQSELAARKDSDLARNMLFSGAYNLSGILKRLETLEKRQPTIEDVRSIKVESKKAVDMMILSYVERPMASGDPQGERIDKLFLDGTALRDFGDTEKALVVFERLMKLANDCSPEHPDYSRRLAAANRSATVAAMIWMDRKENVKALEILERAWESWPISTSDPGMKTQYLYDRTMLGSQYAKVLRQFGRLDEASEVENELGKLVYVFEKLFPSKPNPGPAR